MTDKKFVGRCKPGKFPNQVEIGLTRDDIQKLLDNINEKGFINIRVSKSKDKGVPYAEII